MMGGMVGVVVVSYRNPEMTARFVGEELPRIGVPFRAVVVDNGAEERETAALAERCRAALAGGLAGRLEVIGSRENLGYARGNNLGVGFLRRKGLGFSHWLFSNDDVVLQGTGVVARLIEALDRNPGFCAAGPRVTTREGGEQSPHDSYISPWRQMGWCLLPFLRRRSPGFLKCGRRIQAAAADPPECRVTYWVSGAFLLVKAAAFQAAGGFDPGTFLYGEEMILAERLKRIGGQVVFVPDVQVVHLDGSSSKGSPGLKRIQLDSTAYYYRRYRNVARPTLALWRLVMRIAGDARRRP